MVISLLLAAGNPSRRRACRHSQDCRAYRHASASDGATNSDELEPERSRFGNARWKAAECRPNARYANCIE